MFTRHALGSIQHPSHFFFWYIRGPSVELTTHLHLVEVKNALTFITTLGMILRHEYGCTFSLYRICACISRTFVTRIYTTKLGAAYTRNIMSFWPLSPRRRYCMSSNSQQKPLVFETVILQAVVHARMRQRITGVSAYFNYMRVADHRFPQVGRP
jgi:hypothetical protein